MLTRRSAWHDAVVTVVQVFLQWNLPCKIAEKRESALSRRPPAPTAYFFAYITAPGFGPPRSMQKCYGPGHYHLRLHVWHRRSSMLDRLVLEAAASCCVLSCPELALAPKLLRCVATTSWNSRLHSHAAGPMTRCWSAWYCVALRKAAARRGGWINHGPLSLLRQRGGATPPSPPFVV